MSTLPNASMGARVRETPPWNDGIRPELESVGDGDGDGSEMDCWRLWERRRQCSPPSLMAVEVDIPRVWLAGAP